jgi:hypothetical protein
MRFALPVLFALTLAGALLPAASALADSEGRGGGKGGGGGAPAPLIGLTLLGQAGGAAGIYAAWRKRNRKDKDGE